jgi:hypothetical protein
VGPQSNTENLNVPLTAVLYEGVTKSFRTAGHLDLELQLVQLSDTMYSCIAIL